MTNYSDAAKTYANEHGHADCVRKEWGCATMDLFDAGRDDAFDEAHGVAPASPPVPEPVLLTADDPRWRDGAKVRGEFADGKGGAVEGILSLWSNSNKWFVDYGDEDACYRADVFPGLILLAEAPDPDADKRQAIIETFNGLSLANWPMRDAEAGNILAGLRERGVVEA